MFAARAATLRIVMSESLPPEAAPPDIPGDQPAPPPAAPEAPWSHLPPEPPVISTPPAPPVEQPFVFHGDEREYFRIWIVNTLLTLLTCGVFAAWAKVRKRRYLRGNTELMGQRFDYRANPLRLLIGNLVVVVLFAAYGLFGQVYPLVRLIAIGLGIVLLPWIVVRSLAFNAHNTTYRGLRFYFHQTYAGAAVLYFAQFLLVILSFGLLYPGWIRKQRAFMIGHHRLGDAFFRFDARVGKFYLAYLAGGGLVTTAAMLGGIYIAALTATGQGKVPGLLEMLPFFLCYGFALYVAKHLIYAMLFNHVWNGTRLDEHRFVADLPTGPWVKLQLVNLCAVLGTAGLLYPWAHVRSVRFALAHLRFQPAGPIEKIERLGRDEGSALGETAGEFFGLDFGL